MPESIMRFKEILGDSFDDDTLKVLDIALTFLQTYFGHSAQSAESGMKQFFEKFADRFSADAIHHESSYRMAAIVHFFIEVNSDLEGLGMWLVKNKYNQTPPEALEYFRRNYFGKYKPVL